MLTFMPLSILRVLRTIRTTDHNTQNELTMNKKTSTSIRPAETHDPDCTPKILGPADSLDTPFRPRPTRMTGVREMNGWKLKIYEISLTGQPIASPVVAAAMDCVRERTIWPTDVEAKCGFVMLHQGEDAVWVLAHVWVNDILRQFVHLSPLTDPTHFDTSLMPGANACVWDLEVTKHERDSWVRNVMSDPGNRQLDKYLTDSLEITLDSKETA